jgi:hypothetical protein
MRYEAKIDFWIKILFYLTIGLTTGPVFFMPSEEVIIYVVITLPINIFVLWMMWGTYLEFREEELYVKLGPIYSRVNYDNIKSISLNSSWSSSYAMTMKRVTIKVHSKTWIKGDLQVGPKERIEFVDELTRRCRNLD